VQRRDFLCLIGSAVLPAACGRRLQAGTPLAVPASPATPASRKADIVLEIDYVSVEVAPGRYIRTIAYNGQVPGPLLRMREGRSISVEIRNHTNHDELVHWHGQIVPDTVDGVAELGTPPIPARGRRRYTFTPRPAGTRWYHTHTPSDFDTNKGIFTGQFGVVYVEPRNDPGRYDREVFLVLHEWEGTLYRMAGHTPTPQSPHLTQPVMGMTMPMTMGGGSSSESASGLPHGGMAGMEGMMPMPGAGMSMMGAMSMLEADYALFSINGKALGFGEPIRVRRGERVLFRILNASPTLTHRLALPRHSFEVVALDGNPVSAPRTFDSIELGAAERVDAIVRMDEPGVWVLGSTQDEYRRRGLGIVVEYASQSGRPVWEPAGPANWSYSAFSTGASAVRADGEFVVRLRQLSSRPEVWGINGLPYPRAKPLAVDAGRRYRITMHNMSMMEHPMHLHGHTFEVASVNGRPTAGIFKDTVVVQPMMGSISIDVVTDNPGSFLFHCHNDLHMSGGLATVMRYSVYPSM
jgi:FtsP/CotA-like multicopper oxidase with cupredoxin domain